MLATGEAEPFEGEGIYVVAGNDELMVVLRKAAKELIERGTIRDLDATLDQIVASSVAVVSSADGGGLLRIDERTDWASHTTSDAIYELDRLQSELNEGPCITAADEPPADGVILARDLAGADAERWPSFAPQALARGFRSMLCAQLSSRHEKQHSSLNLYSNKPDAFGDNDQIIAGLFAAQAGLLLHGADAAAGLTHALETRDVIARAKGMLIERFTITDAQAFQMLVTSSQETNIKLVNVARWLTEEADTRALTATRDHGQDKPHPPQ